MPPPLPKLKPLSVCVRQLPQPITTTRRCLLTSSQPFKPYALSRYASSLNSTRFDFQGPTSRPKRHLGLFTSTYVNPPWSPLETQKAGLGTLTTALIIGLLGGVLLAFSASTPIVRLPEPDETLSSFPTTSPTITEEDWEATMTGEVLPGRPGTLTPEQEEKLRQFWIAASRVFGTIDDKFIEELSAKTSPETKEKSPKKSRLGFLSRKHKNDSDADSTASSDTERSRATSIAQGDDKYGQNKQFQDTIAQQTPEALRSTCWSMVKHDHPDALFLRFLRARKWDVDKALVMMISTMNWRAQDINIDDDVIYNGEEGAVLAAKSNDEAAKKIGNGEDFMVQLRMGKSFLHGADKMGRPMCFVRAKLHKQGEQSEISLERCTVYTIETARMMLAPPVDTAVSFFLVRTYLELVLNKELVYGRKINKLMYCV